MVRKYRIVTWLRLDSEEELLAHKEAIVMLRRLDLQGDGNVIYTLEEVEVEEE